MKPALIILTLTACATPAATPPGAPTAAPARVLSVGITVSDLDRLRPLFVDTLAFAPRGERTLCDAGFAALVALPGACARRLDLAAGEERIELTDFTVDGRPPPSGARSNDLHFQHIAIVVSDLDAAVARVAPLTRPISDGPQTIPHTNPAAGGIRAYYFRDADGHSLELIWYPPGKGDPRWQARDRLVLGVDHTAIAVADTARSITFYRRLGLDVAGESLNEGVEQERLSGVPGARVRITGLRGAAGPGVELLEYLAPEGGMPAAPDAANDHTRWEIAVAVAPGALPRLAASLRAQGVPFISPDVVAGALLVRDPDGHTVRLTENN
jgi:catechol 2,3-dioxygenase-like lactoylglutathione lyase family enzyme